ncbi:hypothetical protein HYH03_014096 [Edaphochlamys debaryana]|uniref:Uncharacterized protein n=1 Tax=Edaphochlamys debaryana TaxID=47281 RepID=A0A836BTV9_9CHLO|nr:hypothetical protein HYH03_014096 [Edaphochlamys debaryana]|eukprot:KAG2487254.1 hypothetical protein HYH03_014096 [Edaphochlamys debaryana]
MDALELACVSSRVSDAPGRLELAVAGRWLATCVRSTALGSRNKCLVLVTKLVARVRLAAQQLQHRLSTRGAGPAHPSCSKGRGLQERNVGAEEVDASALGAMSGAGAGGEEGDEEGGEGKNALGPESQVIQTACWTSVKEACLARVMAPRQTRDDIVRRSAGLPYARTALFLAEPSNAPKQLLPRAMTALLAIAGAACSPHLTRDDPPPTHRPWAFGSVSKAGRPRTSAGGGEAAQGPVGAGAGAGAEGVAVVVVEGFPVVQVWPVVHAFNCLRHAFNDSHLAVDTSGYFAQAIQACLLALRSPWWEIRNSAQLCFTALTTRVLGFKNDSHGEAVRKAVSGAEFFARYPPLHGFLLGQLREAAAQLEAASAPAPAPMPVSHPPTPTASTREDARLPHRVPPVRHRLPRRHAAAGRPALGACVG